MMSAPRLPILSGIVVVFSMVAAGCLDSHTPLGPEQPGRYTMRPHNNSAEPDNGLPAARLARLNMQEPPARVKLAGDVAATKPATTQPLTPFSLGEDLPDPSDAEEVFRRRFNRYSEKVRREYEWRDPKTNELRGIFPIATAYINDIKRPNQFRLSLDDCIRRTLAGNYQIRVEGYGPAVSVAQIVQAEAAFDAAFFATVSRQNTDRPVITRGLTGRNHLNVYTAGIRQRLVTGGTVTLAQTLNRNETPGQINRTINPIYTANLSAELRQPFMRGFGIDFNRSQIDLGKNNRDSAVERFRLQAITSLNNVEKAYWTLVGARRAVVISAELLAQAERTLEQVIARSDYDAFQTLVSNARATVKSRQSDFIRVKNSVLDAEDQLRNLMNDPELNLAAGTEIIPTDDPLLSPTVRDVMREIEVALDRRPEIKQAQLAVEVARLNLGIAKNQALPQLDVVFRYTLNGMGEQYVNWPKAGNPDQAFDQMTGHNFVDTYLALEFAWNFAERGERAAIRAAALQHSQSVASFKFAVDNTITDCRVTLRALDTSFRQMPLSNEAVQAAKDQLRSLQERAESKSPEQLNTIFNAQTQLGSTRQALLQAIVTYNQSIVEVERAKGTLLEYDNVALAEQP